MGTKKLLPPSGLAGDQVGDSILRFECVFDSAFVGGGKRDRTADLLHAMQALSQLSYTPTDSLKL